MTDEKFEAALKVAADLVAALNALGADGRQVLLSHKDYPFFAIDKPVCFQHEVTLHER